MVVLYQNPCYYEMCYKGTMLFRDFSVKSKAIFVTVLNCVTNAVRFSLYFFPLIEFPVATF